ncbi:hypothetical protein [Pseudomonas asiatica]|uniref:hypothetical protein n=1 Tax=Pseudomonas asiatica TaxID=2219225 RepID=UPI0014859975|nr:hypothetical protein [Pseudomonas asiatica]
MKVAKAQLHEPRLPMSDASSDLGAKCRQLKREHCATSSGLDLIAEFLQRRLQASIIAGLA